MTRSALKVSNTQPDDGDLIEIERAARVLDNVAARVEDSHPRLAAMLISASKMATEAAENACMPTPGSAPRVWEVLCSRCSTVVEVEDGATAECGNCGAEYDDRGMRP